MPPSNSWSAGFIRQPSRELQPNDHSMVQHIRQCVKPEDGSLANGDKSTDNQRSSRSRDAMQASLLMPLYSGQLQLLNNLQVICLYGAQGTSEWTQQMHKLNLLEDLPGHGCHLLLVQERRAQVACQSQPLPNSLPLLCRFSPDLLGLLASSALAWLAVEVLAVLLGLYLAAINTDLTPFDLVAFSGYKYVGMIMGLLAGLVFGKTGYYVLLGWCCITTFVFMIRTLRLKILLEAAEGVLRRDTQNQLRMYLTVAVSGLQPLLMCWLTFHLIY
ncbi:uncharacterized protein LOC103055927 [Python bivittatus]|uniref:Protein YIF1 n=1 Tax=Python bivittatus TaxID=176946 RepID=A0A9F2R226_PYTBI|nr:uncharacterized protein LOC103055927 [Python bivittatus]